MSESTSATSFDVRLVLRPCCEGWQMGEDWTVVRPGASTFLDLLIFIEEERGVSRHRIQLRFKNMVFSANKLKWTLRRMGLPDDSIVQVEPTLRGSWWWRPREEYVSLCAEEIEQALDASPTGGLYLHELQRLLPHLPPPPLAPQSLRVFLRCYPERFFVHCYTATALTEGESTLWVRRTRRDRLIELPQFANTPHDLGEFVHFSPPPFDWDAYRDIDDAHHVETFESVEEQAARIEAAQTVVPPALESESASENGEDVRRNSDFDDFEELREERDTQDAERVREEGHSERDGDGEGETQAPIGTEGVRDADSLERREESEREREGENSGGIEIDAENGNESGSGGEKGNERIVE